MTPAPPRSGGTTLDERRIRVDGVEIAYWEAGGGSPVLFLHGLGGRKDNWTENFEAFARSHRTVALDLPGFGNSSKGEAPYGIAFFARTVRAFLGAIGLERPSLVGNSMGGHISLRFALDYPGDLDRLVLVDAAGANVGMDPTALPMNPQTLLDSEIPFEPTEDVLRMMMGFIVYENPPVAERLLAQALTDWKAPDARERRQAFLRSAVSLYESPLLDRLGEVRAPTLVVWGEKDRLVRRPNAFAFRDGIPGARLVMYERCGHVPMLERPADFNRDVLAFLAP